MLQQLPIAFKKTSFNFPNLTNTSRPQLDCYHEIVTPLHLLYKAILKFQAPKACGHSAFADFVLNHLLQLAESFRPLQTIFSTKLP